MPEVSIIMPLYNAELYVGDAIKSVLAQSFKDWELIIADDGSTDESLSIARKFEMNEQRIRVISSSNSGTASVPRNKGLRMARGKYIAFLDADDLYEARRLELTVDIFRKHPQVGVVISDFQRFSDKPESPIGSSRFEHILNVWPAGKYWDKHTGSPWISGIEGFKNSILYSTATNTNSITIRKDIIYSQEVWFQEWMRNGEDMELWYRLMINNFTALLPIILSYYRVRENSLSSNSTTTLEAACFLQREVRKKYSIILSNEEYKILLLRHAKTLFALGWNYFRLERVGAARRAYLSSLRMKWSHKTLMALAKTFVPGHVRRIFSSGTSNE